MIMIYILHAVLDIFEKPRANARGIRISNGLKIVSTKSWEKNTALQSPAHKAFGLVQRE